ncbi:MAG: hypothetical protein WC006_06070 [Bacilli bacterium]|nr:hypothetical protein [Bacilli bacterium]
MKKNYKSLLSIALVLLLVAVTALTFAYWDQLTGSSNGEITLGEGQTVTVSGSAISTKKLIPTSAVLGEGDTREIEVTYTVTLKKFNSGDSVKATLTALTINGAETHSGLVNVFLDGVEVAKNEFVSVNPNSDTVVFVVKFTLDEPGDQTAYDAIKAQKIDYTITFDYVKTI